MGNAVGHLERSVTELVAAMAQEGDADREFKTAIEENIVVIAKYKARMEGLSNELALLRKGVREAGGGVAVPTSEEREPARGGAADVEMAAADEEGAGNASGGVYL